MLKITYEIDKSKWRDWLFNLIRSGEDEKKRIQAADNLVGHIGMEVQLAFEAGREFQKSLKHNIGV